MPQLGESVTEGTITRWLKAEGEEVEIDEPLAEVDTDTVAHPVAEEPGPVARAPRSGGNGRGEVQDAETLRLTRSSPAVRRLAAEHDVKIADVPGSGTGGRVTRKDIESYMEEGGSEGEAATGGPSRTAWPPANARPRTRGRWSRWT